MDEATIMKSFGNVGQSLNLAVERFITIGEIIADENIDIKEDMYEAAKEARDAGKSIERLCELSPMTGLNLTHHIEPLKDYGAVMMVAKSLLSSITRILLLVDIIIVKRLLAAKRRATESLEKLESVMNFTEFVRAFSAFGIELTELAYLTTHHQSSHKEERRRAQIFSARQILERSISILLTSSKNCLIHSDCAVVKENRDTVFCQIRRAMDLIHFVVKDSILNNARNCQAENPFNDLSEENESIYSTIKNIIHLIENYKLIVRYYETNNEGNNNFEIDDIYPEYKPEFAAERLYPKNISYKKYSCYYEAEFRQELSFSFEKLFEKTHDFTDSPYISHDHRKNILALCDNCKLELNIYISSLLKNARQNPDTRVTATAVDIGIFNCLEELCKHLVFSVSSQMTDLNESLKLCAKLLKRFHTLAVSHDLEGLNQQSNRFHDYCDYIFDICKLLQHIAPTERLQVQTKCLAISLRIYGPQVCTAAKILWKFTNSSVALENFEAFSDIWKWLTTEITLVAKKIFVSINAPRVSRGELVDKCETMTKSAKSVSTSDLDQELVEYPEAEAKSSADGANTYQNKWSEDLTDNNDILKRAKNMSAMAFLMYQFTKGSGTLRTTQDLFTQAEYFAEEANRLYKVLRHFSYQVPASDNKKELLSILDRVPTFVQALQFTVKDHTVGKAATFVKVDHVIRETKNLMNVINKVVSKCFECANKYKLNFTGITSGMNAGSVRGDENVAGGMGDSKGTTSSSEGSM